MFLIFEAVRFFIQNHATNLDVSSMLRIKKDENLQMYHILGLCVLFSGVAYFQSYTLPIKDNQW